ncbi:lysine decarboxylase, constitutive [Escherichia coli]|uniref:Lysine decarboxylase, constitutive n=1 Tax=Escherichia coli TaxID=562 RepID=A0A2X1NI80_ECOLX|nr:lysine decarboxylase, constitutive [Escherichia coli]
MKPNAGPLRLANSGTALNDADADHMFLDPVKVTILTPGMDEQGNMSEEGIPAALGSKIPRRTWGS